MTARPTDDVPASRAIALGGCVTLLPPVLNWNAFRELYWFGDEWDLLSQIDQGGFWPWVWSVFAENFVPLFKVLWGGAVFLSGGHYGVMLALLWITHAFNGVLFARLLHRSGFPLAAVVACQLTFGLSVLNIETLGWTVQWSAVLATTFLLAGLLVTGRGRDGVRPVLVLALCSAASALSFSRGVLTGAVLALLQLWPQARLRPDLGRTALARAAACLGPAVATAAVIAIFATGNHRSLGEHLPEAATYAAWYFALNPLHRLAVFDSYGPITTGLLAVLKLALIVWGLRRATPGQRHLLVALLLFDLGNSVLLGIGRHHTGLETAISSRYQYGSLLAVLPFLGLGLAVLLSRVPSALHLRRAAAALLAAGGIAYFLHGWSREAPGFAESRGTVTRRLLNEDPAPPAMGAVPGIPFLATERAKELQRRFGLE